ncbi:MAG: hypothetical protein NT013_22905 [Planctomycetia bacterium]|nr:hypothetical protein [Planctomycetia bacterium]
MNRPTARISLQLLRGVVVAFFLQLVANSSASASCGDYLLHRSLDQNSSTDHIIASTLANADEAEMPSPPVPSSPCRGMNCSKPVPLIPVTPLRIQWQHQDHWCFLTMTLIFSDSSGSSDWSWLKTKCQPIHGSFHLDRPPQLG